MEIECKIKTVPLTCLKILERRFFLLPVNVKDKHWYLAVIDNVRKLIEFYDSATHLEYGNTFDM